MKARVKETGEIVDVAYLTGDKNGNKYYGALTDTRTFRETELEMMFYTYDYWTRLEHQYAGMAMQGILMNEKMMLDLHKAFGKNESMDITVSEFAVDIAHTLVEKLKEEK